MPKTLREARALLDGSKFLRGAMGDEVIDHYVHTADWEQFEFDRRITDWSSSAVRAVLKHRSFNRRQKDTKPHPENNYLWE